MGFKEQVKDRGFNSFRAIVLRRGEPFDRKKFLRKEFPFVKQELTIKQFYTLLYHYLRIPDYEIVILLLSFDEKLGDKYLPLNIEYYDPLGFSIANCCTENIDFLIKNGIGYNKEFWYYNELDPVEMNDAMLCDSKTCDIRKFVSGNSKRSFFRHSIR
ncbi:MAG: hypothetical protein OEY38_18785 [Gammaproteobacteria bacterium]|nr:hypothetical protein [Gammaproteobacteria bacterium]